MRFVSSCERAKRHWLITNRSTSHYNKYEEEKRYRVADQARRDVQGIIEIVEEQT